MGSSRICFDYDNDGRLYCFGCRFVDFSKGHITTRVRPNIPALKGLNEYCYPKVYTPMSSWLFHNNGTARLLREPEMGISDNPAIHRCRRHRS